MCRADMPPWNVLQCLELGGAFEVAPAVRGWLAGNVGRVERGVLREAWGR